jgi:uncharacterized membrane protein (UPF0182 family)
VIAANAELRNDTETIPNARLLDPNVLADTFTARQQIRNVYGFPEKLDIDRYTVDGHAFAAEPAVLRPPPAA